MRKAGLREPRGGAVTVMQRFSSDLRTHHHLRSVHVVFDAREVKRLLSYLRCFRDPLPIHPAREPPEHPEALDFP